MGYENARLRIHYVNRDEQFDSVIPRKKSNILF